VKQEPLPETGHASASIKLWEDATVPVGTCPDCEAEVHVDLDADKGDNVACDECGSTLEIVGLDPVELDIAEEDLDDDDDDEEDF
jgi:lysine biosynthesis protein LysW